MSGFRPFRSGHAATALAACALLLPTSASYAGDAAWPRFRGPGGSGVSSASGVPAKFTEADYNWRVKLPGDGPSSPVVWGDKVFVTSAEKDRGRRHVLCLSARGGRKLWQKSWPFRPFRVNTKNSFAVATPALDARHVYLVWTSPKSVAVVALGHNGREVWKRDLGPYSSQHGPGPSPVVVGGVVILGNDQEGNESFLVGLDGATGRIRWKRKRRGGKASYSTPAVLVREGGRREVVFTSTSHGITSLDPATGKLVWESEPFKNRCVSSPVIVRGLVFATAGQGGGGREAVAVRPPRRIGGRAEVAYRIERELPYVPTPIAVGDLMFVWNEKGRVTCVRAEDGKVIWQESVGGRYYGSPVCVGGRLYAISMKGEVVVISASEKYKLLARNPLGEASYATPAVSGGVMYLRTKSQLISLGGRP